MSNRNVHRNSYIEHDFSDEDSSDSEGYLEDFRSLRGDRRESNRSLRSSRRSLRNSPPRSIELDDDSEHFPRQENGRSHRHQRDRRAGSAARSISTRADKKSKKHSSEMANSQDSESELGTRAKVQAKIREKIAQQHQSSLDESSSDFFKPKAQASVKPKVNDCAKKTNGTAKKVSAEAQTSTVKVATAKMHNESAKSSSAESTVATANTEQSGPIGIQSKTADLEWECEYCTFANEPNTRICAICCKTASNAPLKSSMAGNSTAVNASPETEAISRNEAAVTTDANVIDKSKGRERKLSKKISFWPGTKSK